MAGTGEILWGKKEFFDVARTGKLAWLAARFNDFDISPSSVLKVLENTQPICLLESAGGSPQLTEYSYLGLDPLLVFEFKNAKYQINYAEGRKNDQIDQSSDNPFELLRSLIQGLVTTVPPAEPPIPFWGGAMGFLSYDAGRYIEHIPIIARDDLFLPELYFIFPGTLIVFNHISRELYLIVSQFVDADIEKSYEEAYKKMVFVQSQLERMQRMDLSSKLNEVFPVDLKEDDTPLACSVSRPEFERMVERIQEYIRAGDVYQVNVSQRLEVPYTKDPFVLYKKLKEVNPSPFAAYLNCGNFQLVSSSPERLIMLRDGAAFTRPIAGTRRRGEDFNEDSELAAELILDEKERAEHIMLVDLERNDLGRVCRFGTVVVDELMVLEKYSHVIHIVSGVKGELRGEKDQFDLMQAMFPGGTITGCPKVRCMEIIEELEPVRRGPYTGSIGYFGFNGNMDMNIIIRTFIVKDNMAYVQVGAGVVIDSKPDREYFETLSKADALLIAAGCPKEVRKWEKLPM